MYDNMKSKGFNNPHENKKFFCHIVHLFERLPTEPVLYAGLRSSSSVLLYRQGEKNILIMSNIQGPIRAFYEFTELNQWAPCYVLYTPGIVKYITMLDCEEIIYHINMRIQFFLQHRFIFVSIFNPTAVC